MPSSSMRSTALEHHLYSVRLPTPLPSRIKLSLTSFAQIYRVAYARLQNSFTTTQAIFTHRCFSAILDIDEHELTRCLKEGWNTWLELREQNDRMKLSDQIFQAGNAFVDAARALGKAGREKEKSQFEGWAEELWHLSLTTYELEQRR